VGKGSRKYRRRRKHRRQQQVSGKRHTIHVTSEAELQWANDIDGTLIRLPGTEPLGQRKAVNAWTEADWQRNELFALNLTWRDDSAITQRTKRGSAF